VPRGEPRRTPATLMPDRRHALERFRALGVLRDTRQIHGETAMKRILLSTSAAMLLGLATIATAASAERTGGSGGVGNGGGAAVSRSVGERWAPGRSSRRWRRSVARRRNGNDGKQLCRPGARRRHRSRRQCRSDQRLSFPRAAIPQASRGAHAWTMTAIATHDHRFRGPRFAFGFYPGYDYTTYNYDDGCYQWQEVPTRRGWRWLRVWVCD